MSLLFFFNLKNEQIREQIWKSIKDEYKDEVEDVLDVGIGFLGKKNKEGRLNARE